MKKKYYSDTFYRLKGINPLELNLHLDKDITLSKEEVIELTHHYIKVLINKKTESSKKLKSRWLILNNSYRKAFLSNTRIHLFRTNTGSGKTVTSILWVKFLTQLSKKIEGFVVLSPEYKHGTYEVEKIIKKYGQHYKEGVDFIKFEGKGRLCEKINTKINVDGLTVGMLMENKITTTEYCEKECEYRNECIYIGNRKIILAEKGGIKNWIGVQRQISYIIPIFLIHVGDVVLIIDENFTDAIKEHFIYNVSVLKENIDFLDAIINRFKPDDDEIYKYFVEEFKKLLVYFKGFLYKPEFELDYKYVSTILDNIDDAKGLDNAYIEMLNNQAYHYIKSGKLEPFNFIFGEMCNYIDNYEDLLISNYDDIDNWMRASFYKSKHKLTFLYYDKHKLDLILDKDNLIKLIINDATANKLELSYLLGDKEPVVEYIEEWYYDNAEYHQLNKLNTRKDRKYSHYPKASFMYKTTFNYMMNNLKAILEKHKDETVLVVAREIGKKKRELKKMELINGGMKLSDYILSNAINKYGNVIFDDYPLKGTNIYSDINVIVILGRPELPQASIKRQSNLIGSDTKLYRKEFSTTSIIQAIGRIMRGDKHKYVYLLTGFNLNKEIKKPIKSYKSHTDFQKRLKAETKIIEDKKIKIDEDNKIFKYIKENKYISIKNCELLLKISNYKAHILLDEYEDKKILKSKKLKIKGKGQPKIVFFMNSD